MAESVITEQAVVLTDEHGDTLRVSWQGESYHLDTDAPGSSVVYASPEALRAFAQQVLDMLGGDA